MTIIEGRLIATTKGNADDIAYVLHGIGCKVRTDGTSVELDEQEAPAGMLELSAALRLARCYVEHGYVSVDWKEAGRTFEYSLTLGRCTFEELTH